MSNEIEKTIKKLNDDKTLQISGGENIPPKEEHIYVCHKPSFKHPFPIAPKYGALKPEAPEEQKENNLIIDNEKEIIKD